MANETGLSVLNAHLATEVLSERHINAYRRRCVLWSLVHHDPSMKSAKSNTKDYTVRGQLGTSSGGSELIRATPTRSLDTGTTISVSISEGVLDMAWVSELAASTALGVDLEDVQRIIDSGSQQEFEALLAPLVAELIPRGMSKIESDLLALLSGASRSVGSTGVDNSLANAIALPYTFDTGSPLRSNEEAVYLFTANQAQELVVEALGTNGGVAGSIWGTPKADFDIANRVSDFETQGLKGTFLGYNVHVYDPALNVTANAGADVVGGFGVFGRPGVAPDSPEMGGAPGALVYLERAPLKLRYMSDLEGRGAGILMNAYYGVGELVDSNFVALVTDAP